MSTTNEKDLQSLLTSFRFSAEPAAEDFLRRIAIRHEKNGISRTYLYLGRDDSGSHIVRGFFTLAVKCLSLNERHSIPEGVFEQMNVDRGVAQAFLLGQLAKADGAEKGFGREMVELAFDLFYKGNGIFGCRVVRLDSKDRLLNYYRSFGFEPIGKNHNGTLNQMVAII